MGTRGYRLLQLIIVTIIMVEARRKGAQFV